ncbi:MAG: NADH dehydrogenase (quinone) subunit D [Candidatus Polarisedimenticolia bacterium]
MSEQRQAAERGAIETITINMGPSHPSTHGVLRLVLELDGETVVSCKPDLGYLHRGFEKIAENKTWQQFVTWTDRMDYLAPVSNNVAYVLAVEKLLGLEIPPRARAMRVILCEMARISAHLLWLGTHALDLGAATVFFYTFQQREYLYDLFEQLTGARMTTSTVRIGGMSRDVPEGWPEKLAAWNKQVPAHYDEMEGLLTRNRIWLDRTQNVGVISLDQAKALGLTGPPLRASGIEWDLRKAQPYLGYEEYDFEIPAGTVGDVYDRYLVRIEEMRQSSKIIDQALARLPEGPILADAPKVVLPPKEKVLTSMEDLIHHFVILTEGIRPPLGEVYHAIEAPKGELGFYVVSDGGPSAYRCRIRPAAFCNLQAIETMAVGALVADVVAIIGSLDPVMGEVDR